jgi:hypothetical protein
VLKATLIENNAQKQEFEGRVKEWNKVMKNTAYVVKYENHWYEKEYVYLLTEFCIKGNLAEEIAARKSRGQKFKENVLF